ncbi:hypothetical protein FRB99_001578, partial [Tulasnella sp. 403]
NCKDTSTITIAEHILSITSEWVASVKRRRKLTRNRAMPIYRLPSEILSVIFQLCLPSDEFRLPLKSGNYDTSSTANYYTCLLKLCGVAFDWARLIRDTSSFWVYTCSWDHPKLTDIILERSRTSLLWVEYNSVRLDYLDSAEMVGRYIRNTRRESHRWGTLVLRLWDTPAVLSPDSEELGAATFPKLSRLMVITPDHAFNRLPNFFKFGRPPLKHLQVVGVELDWDRWPPHPELIVLRLCSTRHQDLRISYLQICNIIDASPSLKTLELSSIYITGLPRTETHALSSSSPKPVLDTLEFMTIEPAHAVPFLLSRVELHNNATVSTYTSFRGRSTTLEIQDACRIVESVSQRLSSLASATSCLPRLSIFMRYKEEGDFKLYYNGSDFQITFSDTPEGGARINSLVQSLDTELRSRRTILHLALQPPTSGLVGSLSGHLSNVVGLSIGDAHLTTFPLQDLRSLSEAQTTGWLFPGTKVLRLVLKSDNLRRDIAHSYPALFETLCEVADARLRWEGTWENVVALEKVSLYGAGIIHKRDIEELEALVPKD